MQYRDSSIATHHGRGMVLGVDSSHGVKIEGGSTGGLIVPVGDDTDISISIQGKGAGGVFLGGSSSPFSGFLMATDTAVATPNFATTNAMVMETTHTITGLPAATAGATSNAFVLAHAHNLSTDCALVGAYVGSTAGQVHCRFAKVSTLTVGASTATISFLVVRR
jgi:hypothetical protein